jgi:hypothetical protein
LKKKNLGISDRWLKSSRVDKFGVYTDFEVEFVCGDVTRVDLKLDGRKLAIWCGMLLQH